MGAAPGKNIGDLGHPAPFVEPPGLPSHPRCSRWQHQSFLGWDHPAWNARPGAASIGGSIDVSQNHLRPLNAINIRYIYIDISSHQLKHHPTKLCQPQLSLWLSQASQSFSPAWQSNIGVVVVAMQPPEPAACSENFIMMKCVPLCRCIMSIIYIYCYDQLSLSANRVPQSVSLVNHHVFHVL